MDIGRALDIRIVAAGQGKQMILRVFPRKTVATPDDENVRIGEPTLFDQNKNYEKVLISVVFTWDIPEAERLYRAWRDIAPTELGGPALNSRANEFVPGMFLKHGYVITSRGCPNRCWFCTVRKREPNFIELDVKEGNHIQDNNILATSESHFCKVIEMLKTQSMIEFDGGLEAALLKDFHVALFKKIKIHQMFFAYDMPENLPDLQRAGNMLKEAGFNYMQMRCYVLIGYKNDTFEKAMQRLYETHKAGFLPFAMLYTQDGKYNKEWRNFSRFYMRPAWTKSLFKATDICNFISGA